MFFYTVCFPEQSNSIKKELSARKTTFPQIQIRYESEETPLELMKISERK